MRSTGKRSNTSRRFAAGRAAVFALVLFFLMIPGARPCRALDVFTLWRQTEFPLTLEAGAWADYRTQVMAGGRRESGLLRVACVGRTGEGAWILELLPLEEADDGSLHHVAGNGVRLELDVDAIDRERDLMEAVGRMIRWRDGMPAAVSVAELREDPLVAASLDQAFVPDLTERKADATRIVQGVELMCRQFVMTAADTQSVDLPAGNMVQVTTREVTAAVHDTIPFLGVAYAAERIRDESRLDPPSRRFQPPPPRIRVEVMELVGFGKGAVPLLRPED